MKNMSLELFQAHTSGHTKVCILSCQPLRQIQQQFHWLSHDKFLKDLQHKICNRLHTQNFIFITSTLEPHQSLLTSKPALTSINLSNTASPPTSHFLGCSTSDIQDASQTAAAVATSTTSRISDERESPNLLDMSIFLPLTVSECPRKNSSVNVCVASETNGQSNVTLLIDKTTPTSESLNLAGCHSTPYLKNKIKETFYI